MSLYDELLAMVDPALLPLSGEVFLSGRTSFEGQPDLYLLGLNPGGDPDLNSEWTISRDTTEALTPERNNWSAYADQSWRGGIPAGQHPYQRSVLHLLHELGLDERRTPSTNVIFARTAIEAHLGKVRKAELLAQCWPVHARAIDGLGVRVVLCFGRTAAWWVRQQLGAHELIESFVEDNGRRWASHAHATTDHRLQVLTLTHPSRADWTNRAADPTALVNAALARR